MLRAMNNAIWRSEPSSVMLFVSFLIKAFASCTAFSARPLEQGYPELLSYAENTIPLQFFSLALSSIIAY